MNKFRDFALASMAGRAIGKTTKLAKICKELGGIMICSNKVQAKRIMKEHSIRTICLADETCGLKGPFIFDHYALETLLFKAADEIDTAHCKIFELENEISELRILLSSSLVQIKNLQSNKRKKCNNETKS